MALLSRNSYYPEPAAGAVPLREIPLLDFSGAAKDIDDFMLVQLLQLLACRAKVIPRIKLTGLFYKYLADGSSHCQAAVAVDIDLADG